MALSLHPEGENWDYLVRSLSVLENQSADEVLKALSNAPRSRPTIQWQFVSSFCWVSAPKNKTTAMNMSNRCWNIGPACKRPEGAKNTMRPWQKWYAKMYPDRVRPAELPREEESRWDFDQLVGYLDSSEGRYGDPIHGREVFRQSPMCPTATSSDPMVTRLGQTLSGIARRFTKREIVESILYPAHVISSQYASKKVLTLDGRVLIGIVSEGIPTAT